MTIFLKIIGVLEIVASAILAIVALVDKQYILFFSFISNIIGGAALFILGTTREDTDSSLYLGRENSKRIAVLEKHLQKSDENPKEKAPIKWVKFSSKENQQDN